MRDRRVLTQRDIARRNEREGDDKEEGCGRSRM